MNTGAIFSDCRKYRYRLWREWDASLPTVAFFMLNPSTADDVKNDPTIARCVKRAILLGYGRLEVINLFAFRSTNPARLRTADDPIGPDNVGHIKDVFAASSVVICGWGKHGGLRNMSEFMVKFMKTFYPGKAYFLRLNLDGSPAHPLYIPYDVRPVEYP